MTEAKKTIVETEEYTQEGVVLNQAGEKAAVAVLIKDIKAPEAEDGWVLDSIDKNYKSVVVDGNTTVNLNVEFTFVKEEVEEEQELEEELEVSEEELSEELAGEENSLEEFSAVDDLDISTLEEEVSSLESEYEEEIMLSSEFEAVEGEILEHDLVEIEQPLMAATEQGADILNALTPEENILMEAEIASALGADVQQDTAPVLMVSEITQALPESAPIAISSFDIAPEPAVVDAKIGQATQLASELNLSEMKALPPVNTDVTVSTDITRVLAADYMQNGALDSTAVAPQIAAASPVTSLPQSSATTRSLTGDYLQGGALDSTAQLKEDFAQNGSAMTVAPYKPAPAMEMAAAITPDYSNNPFFINMSVPTAPSGPSFASSSSSTSSN